MNYDPPDKSTSFPAVAWLNVMNREREPTSPSPEQSRVLDLVNRHGWNATAFQTLEAGYSYAFFGSDACVAYVDTGSAWVVAGAPIAAAEDLAPVVNAFVAEARAASKRCCFFGTEERLMSAVGGTLRSLAIGEQPVWDPRRWGDVLAGSRSLREQLRRARAKGVRVRRLTQRELAAGPMRDALLRVGDRWLATRRMASLEFLVRLDLFSFTVHRHCFVAEIEGQVIGFAGVIPVPARGGWFIENLVRDPRAPNGTGELLVDAVMRWASAEGCSWLTLGLAPLAGDVARTLRIARRSTSLLYDFSGVRRFKAKLRPHSWSPIYLSYPTSQGAVRSVIDALLAFIQGRFLIFALRSLLRGSTFVIAVLTALLVPWTLLLALASAEQWFYAPWIKWSWVAFDVLLAAALFRYLARPSKMLVTILAFTVTVDALLTFGQALAFNLRAASILLDYVLIAVGCFAPVLAACVLWGAACAQQPKAGVRTWRPRVPP